MTKRLTISGNYAYNDAHLTQNVPGLIHFGNKGYFVADGLADERLPGSQKNSGSLTADFELPLGISSMEFNWAATYNGNIMTRPGDMGYGQLLPVYVTDRALIGYKFKDQGFVVKVYADNIFDKYAVTSVGNNLSKRIIDNSFASGYYTQSVATPRRAGIALNKVF